MSLEPQTTAKVRIQTTKGSIEIELWAKETPITSRVFLESILNQDFNNCAFDRVIPNFIVQLGDNPDLETNEKIGTFKDEINSRLKFNKRGLVGAVNSNKKNSNNGKFFITLNDANELNGKNTLFGKITPDTIFTVLKISEGEVDGEKPLYPVKILKSEVLIPYFDDLRKREKKVEVTTSKETQKVPSKKKKLKVKLNLVDDEEEEEGDLEIPVIKMKSAHEILKKSINEEAKENKQVEETINTEDEVKAETTDQKEEHIIVEKEEVTPSDFSKSQPSAKELDDYDENFDNLDEESDDDIDLFKHELKFTENPENKLKTDNDDLITIDPTNKRRKDDNTYKDNKRSKTRI